MLKENSRVKTLVEKQGCLIVLKTEHLHGKEEVPYEEKFLKALYG